MIAPAVVFYDVVLWLHIAAVVVGFGSTFAYALIPTHVAKTRRGRCPPCCGR